MSIHIGATVPGGLQLTLRQWDVYQHLLINFRDFLAPTPIIWIVGCLYLYTCPVPLGIVILYIIKMFNIIIYTLLRLNKLGINVSLDITPW